MTRRVVVHAGVDTEPTDATLDALRRAASRGLAALEQSSSATVAAAEAVTVLEDEPSLNAGVGSVMNEDGDVEADAAVVDGTTQRFAAVAAISGFRNPVRAANALLEQSDGPVILTGDGARRHALRAGLEEADLRTPEQRRIWEQVTRHGLDAGRSLYTGRPVSLTETVGAIVVDGTAIAAAASTGGLLMKRVGRVGDCAVFGSGIYADGSTAVLCSGNGEATIELHLALRTALRLSQPDGDAVTWAVDYAAERKALRGGVVAYDARRDRVTAAHNATSFPILSATPDEGTIVDATVVERQSA